MADASDWPSENSACKENSSSRQVLDIIASDNVRIVLFKEGRLKECQLLFDSSSFYTRKNGAVSDFDKITKTGSRAVEENLHLSEMIFGSTAMSYNDTYFKMHDVSSPHRIIFTQVFPMSNRRSVRQREKLFSSKDLLDKSKSDQWNEVDSMKSLSGKFSSRGSNLQSLLSLTNTNSTTTTMDSGFSDQFSTSDFSSSSGLSLNQVVSTQSMSSASDFSSQDSFLLRDRRSLRHSRLGLALIIPYSTEKETYLDFFMENINFVNTLLNRLRRYIDIAYRAPEAFLSAMLETSTNSAHWISNLASVLQKNENGADKNQDSSQSPAFGLCSFGKTLKEKFNSWTVRAIGLKKHVQTGLFRNLLTDLETKDRNFFLSTILTNVLTYHSGWIRTCCKSSENSSFVPRNSYNALWWQLMDLCQTFGSVNINSRIVVSGCDATMLDKILNFIRYFIRYSKVVKQDVRRDDAPGDNKEIDMICDRLYRSADRQTNKEAPVTLKNNKTSNYNLSDLVGDGDSEFPPPQEANGVMFILGDDERLVDLKKTDLSSKIYKSNFSEKSRTLMRSKKTLSGLASLIEGDDCLDADRGQSMLTQKDSMRMKMKVLTFPLPKFQASDFSEMFSHPLGLRRNSSDTIVPDIILQGSAIPMNLLVDELRQGLSSKVSCASRSTEDEAIAILGDVEKWIVKVISNKRYSIRESSLCDNMDPSDLVSGMLDVLLQMGKLNIPRQYCKAHVEQKLLEICLRSRALAKLLLNVEFGSIDMLMSALDIEASDIPLLMSVVSQIEPEVSRKYGLSYQ